MLPDDETTPGVPETPEAPQTPGEGAPAPTPPEETPPEGEKPAEGEKPPEEGAEAPSALQRVIDEMSKLEPEKQVAFLDKMIEAVPEDRRGQLSALRGQVEERQREADRARLREQEETRERELAQVREEAEGALADLDSHLAEVRKTLRENPNAEVDYDGRLINASIKKIVDAGVKAHGQESLREIGRTIIDATIKHGGPMSDIEIRSMVERAQKDKVSMAELYLERLVKGVEQKAKAQAREEMKPEIEKQVNAELAAKLTEASRDTPIPGEPGGGSPAGEQPDLNSIPGVARARRNGRMTEEEAQKRLRELISA